MLLPDVFSGKQNHNVHGSFSAVKCSCSNS